MGCFILLVLGFKSVPKNYFIHVVITVQLKVLVKSKFTMFCDHGGHI